MRIAFSTPFKPYDLHALLDPESQAATSPDIGINAPSVSPLVRELHKRGHDLLVFSLDPKIKDPVLLTGNRLTIHVYPKRRTRYCMMDCYSKERRFISKAIEKQQPEVISAQWSYEHALAAIDTGLPTVLTCHDTPLRYAWQVKSLYMAYHLLIAFKTIRKANRLIAVSPYTAEHVQKYFRPPAHIQTISNGLPESWFETRDTQRTFKPSNTREITIISIGSWGKLKNISRLIEANHLLGERGKKTRLILYGAGLGVNEAGHNWSKKRALDSGVKFRGLQPRDEIMKCLTTEADLMMHPSTIETHGMVLIEAMACGVPVIGGEDSGAVPWTLDDGKSGILCDIRSSKAIADCIHYAINHPVEVNAMAEYARSSVKQRFRISAVAKAHEQIFAEILKK